MRAISSFLCSLLTLLFTLFLIAPVTAAQEISGYLSVVDAELFDIDRSHSSLTFSTHFLGIVEVRATFERYSASILHDEDDPSRTSVTLVIDVNSIDTNNDSRDSDLLSERFFHAEAYPVILFQSTHIDRTPSGFIAHGDLTIRGITKKVSIPFDHVLRRTADPIWGNIRIGFSGSTSLSRADFGVVGGSTWGADMVLSDKVEVEFSLLGTIMNMEKIAFSSQEKLSIGEVVQTRMGEEGLEAAIATYHRLKKEQPDGYNFAESQLNRLGYKLMQKERYDEAVAIFELNAAEFPDSANVYSSLGEAYAALGDKGLAVAMLERSLAMNPESTVALEILRHLK